MTPARVRSSVAKFFTRLFAIGITPSTEEAAEKYIVLINMNSVISCSVNQLTGLAILFFTDNTFGGCLCLLTGLGLLVPMLLNHLGKQFYAKIFMVVFTNLAVLLFFCLFEQNTMFVNYYFSIIAAANFLFTYKERYWLWASVVLSLFLYLLLSTSFFDFLPVFFSIKDKETSILIVRISHVLMIFFDMFAYLQINKTREDILLAKQKQILQAQRQLEIQNEDLETFSIAASHSIQTPIHVSKYFLYKMANSPQATEQTRREHLAIVQDCIEQMNQMVTGLFSYNQSLK
jgi:signal transduction histidine kinase